MLSQPLTHLAYLSHCARQTLELGTQKPIRVQVRRKGVTHCATVYDIELTLQAEKGQWFTVELEHNLGRAWVEHRNVRLCEGDGCCACEP